MNSKTLNELRAKLEDRRGVLIEAMRNHLLNGEFQAAPRSMDEGAKDPGDESVTDLASDMTLYRSVSEGVELADVQRALERMEHGEYGVCVDCGGTIPVERLRIQPTALRCVPCQTRFEQVNERDNPPNF